MVSRIITLAIPYDDCVVRVQIRQYFVHSHLAHVRVQNTIRLLDHNIVDVTVKVQAASVVLKVDVDEGLVCVLFRDTRVFREHGYSELRRNQRHL